MRHTHILYDFLSCKIMAAEVMACEIMTCKIMAAQVMACEIMTCKIMAAQADRSGK